MRLLHRYGDTTVACSLLALTACGGVESTSPNADASRVLSALQIESSSILSASLNARALSSTVTWSPPMNEDYVKLFVPANVVEVRDTVRAGETVGIVVNTIGENGCWQADGGSLTQRGDSAIITPYDRHSGASACTMIWTDRLRHAFSTVFPSAGTGVIRVYGRRIRENKANYSVPVIAERTVVVLP